MKLFEVFKSQPEKHKVVIIYEDRVKFYEIDYPQDGRFKLDDNTEYYLDPARTVHVFIHGFVNEVDGAKVLKNAEDWKFEPSYTFTYAMDSKIIRDIFSKVEGSVATDWVLVAMIAVNVVVLFLVWNLYQNLDKIMKFLGVG